MTTLAWCLLIVAVLLIGQACNRGNGPRHGESWFEVYPNFTPGSKKARTRGDISRDGLTRRERAHR